MSNDLKTTFNKVNECKKECEKSISYLSNELIREIVYENAPKDGCIGIKGVLVN